MGEWLPVSTLKHRGITFSGHSQTWGNHLQWLLSNMGEWLPVSTLKHTGIAFSGHSQTWGNHLQWLLSKMGESLPVAILKHGGIASSGYCVTFPKDINEPAQILRKLHREINVHRQDKNESSKEFLCGVTYSTVCLTMVIRKSPYSFQISLSVLKG